MEHIFRQLPQFDLRQYALDHVKDGVYWINDQARILDVNEGACRMVGYSIQELTSMTVARIDPNYQTENWPDHWEKLREAGSLTFESNHRHKDGHLLDVEITANLFVVDGMEINCAFVRDIPDRKRAERARAKDQAALNTIIENIPYIVFVKDKNLRYEYVNHATEQFLGKSREVLIGRDITSYFSPGQARKIMEDEARIVNNGQNSTYEQVVLVDNKEHHFLTTKGPIRDDAGNVIGLFCIARDITDQRQYEDQLRRSEEMLRAVFEGNYDGLCLVDAETRQYAASNPAFSAMLGYSPNELKSTSVLDYHCAEDLPFVIEQFEKSVRREISVVADIPVKRKNGSIFYADIKATPVTFGGRNYLLGCFHDMTEHKEAEAELVKSKISLEEAQRVASIGSWSLDLVSGKLEWSDEIFRIFEIDMQKFGATYEAFLNTIHPDDRDAVNKAYTKSVTNKTPYQIIHRLQMADGRIKWVEERCETVFGTDEMPILSRGTVQDITERKQAEEELKLASMVFDNAGEGILVSDENNNIIAVNRAFTDITGYSLEEVRDKNPRIFQSGHHDDAFYEAMWQAINTKGHWSGEVWDKRKNGEMHAKQLSINTIRNEDGNVHRYVALFFDITDKKKSEELIWHQANYDALTDLPNRRMFRDRLEQEARKSQRSELPLAVLLIDLDRFKEVNDSLGHDKGDLLLVDAAQRIRSCVRESDTVARLGGDEFIIILPEIDDIGSIDRVAQGITDKLSMPFRLEADEAFISASIGISLYPNDSLKLDDLLKNADQAMYAAKSAGRNRFGYFTRDMQAAAQKRLYLANELRTALTQNQFKVYYQPIVELDTGRIYKAEALIRWQHPARGMISPMDFIPLAEESGLIIPIGDWVFRQAVQQVKLWRSKYKSFQISVNKSPLQMSRNDDFSWPDYLKQADVPGRAIAIEITEGLLLNAEPEINRKLLEFRDADIKVAIDDFGTGYSSLSYLKKFDIDYLKIDKSFVDHLGEDADDLALCEAIIVMAHKLGLKVIAEGVETTLQRDILLEAGCDYAQGYLYSRPVPADEFEKLLI